MEIVESNVKFFIVDLHINQQEFGNDAIEMI